MSAKHGEVARDMFLQFYPELDDPDDVPCTSITNGVHVPSWLAWQMRLLYDRHFPAEWAIGMGEPQAWQNIQNVDPGELWETHNTLKNLLLTFVRRRVSRQCRRRNESDSAVDLARPSMPTTGGIAAAIYLELESRRVDGD